MGYDIFNGPDHIIIQKISLGEKDGELGVLAAVNNYYKTSDIYCNKG